MGKYVNLFTNLYLILLLFVFANFVLGYNGYAFTPLLWNPWLYLGAVTVFVISGIAFIELTQSIGRM